MVAEALARTVKDAEIREKEARDNEAYRRMPHTKEEIAEAAVANAKAWAHLDEADKDVNWEEYFEPKRDLGR